MTSVNSSYWGDNPRFFIGTVKRNDDPAKMGRCQVRIFGIHDSVENIPDRDLPWAQTLIPTTSGGISGNGENANIGRGAMVYGVFLDGTSSQIPLIIGSFTTVQQPSYIQLSQPTLSGPPSAPYVSPGTSNSPISPGKNPIVGIESSQPNKAEILASAEKMTGSDIEEKIFHRLCKNMNPAIACGFLGNIRTESGPGVGEDFYTKAFDSQRAGLSKYHRYDSLFQGKEVFIQSGPWSEIVNPDDVGLPAFGLCQWRGKRWEHLLEFAEKQGEPWQGLKAQCDFIWWELTHTEKSAWAHIESSGNDTANAAYHVCRYFERPAYQFVQYPFGDDQLLYTSSGTHKNHPGRKYYSNSLNIRIRRSLGYYQQYVQGNVE